MYSKGPIFLFCMTKMWGKGFKNFCLESKTPSAKQERQLKKFVASCSQADRKECDLCRCFGHPGHHHKQDTWVDSSRNLLIPKAIQVWSCCNTVWGSLNQHITYLRNIFLPSWGWHFDCLSKAPGYLWEQGLLKCSVGHMETGMGDAACNGI